MVGALQVLFYVSVSHVGCVSRVSSHYSCVLFEFRSCKIRLTTHYNVLFWLPPEKWTWDWVFLSLNSDMALKCSYFIFNWYPHFLPYFLPYELIFTRTIFCESLFKLLFHFCRKWFLQGNLLHIFSENQISQERYFTRCCNFLYEIYKKGFTRKRIYLTLARCKDLNATNFAICRFLMILAAIN